MKKALIGMSFITLGCLSILVQIQCAVPVAMNLKAWSGGRLWYVLFSTEYFDLRALFIVSAIVFLVGIVLSLLAYFERDKQ